MTIKELCKNDLKELQVEIGNSLKAIREEKGLKIYKVAKKIKRPEQLIFDIENGKCNSIKKMLWLLYVYDKKMKITFY